MSDLNIDDFYRDAALILTRLYRKFPRKSMILIEELIGPDTPDDFGLHSDRHQACFGAAVWLAESGYISYEDTIRQEGLDQVVLSHKGFTLLSSKTQAVNESYWEGQELLQSLLEDQQTNIHQMRVALESGSSRDLKRIMQALMNQSAEHV